MDNELRKTTSLRIIFWGVVMILAILLFFSCTKEVIFPCECEDVVYTRWNDTEINRFPIRYNELICDQNGDTIVNNLKYYTIRECSYD